MRNTYNDQKPPNQKNDRPGNNSKERFTYTANNNKVQSMQKHTNMMSNHDRLTKNILSILKRLSFDGRYSVCTTLKSNQKTLINTIAHLLNSFDDKFQPAQLEVDMLIDLFKMLGYPSTINKTYFQPVGAPHTWGQCLQMMQWLAQLAAFHYDMNLHMIQAQVQEDLNEIMVRSYLQGKPNIPKESLQKQVIKIQKDLNDIKYNIQSKQLAVKNLNASQKNIHLMQEQEKYLQQILFRQKEEVISYDQTNAALSRKLQQFQNQIQTQQKRRVINQKQIMSLEKEINTQELSVQEVQRINQEIKEYREKIIALKKSHQIEVEQIQKTNDNIISSYRDFSNFIDEISGILSKVKVQIQSRNIYLNFPQLNFNNFVTFLKDKKQQRAPNDIQKMMGTNLIKQILQKKAILISIINNQEANLKIKKEAQVKQSEQLMRFNFDKENICIQQQKLLKQCQRQNNKQKSEQYDLDRMNSTIISKDNQLQNRIRADKQAHVNIITDLKKINEQIKQDSQFLNAFEVKSQQSIESMLIKAQELKQKMIQLMIDQRDYFKSLNDSLNEDGMSQNQNGQMNQSV